MIRIKPSSKKNKKEWNGEYYVNFDIRLKEERSWIDAKRYGFISACGGDKFVKPLEKLQPEDKIWVYIPKIGYVGVGKVIETVVPAREAIFEIDGTPTRFFDLCLKNKYHFKSPESIEECLVKVHWMKAVDETEAIKEQGFFSNQHIVCKPTCPEWLHTIERLKEVWEIN